jgi:hypothetical protein
MTDHTRARIGIESQYALPRYKQAKINRYANPDPSTLVNFMPQDKATTPNSKQTTPSTKASIAIIANPDLPATENTADHQSILHTRPAALAELVHKPDTAADATGPVHRRAVGQVGRVVAVDKTAAAHIVVADHAAAAAAEEAKDTIADRHS